MTADDIIHELVSTGPRPAGSPANTEARETIVRWIRQIGLSVQRDEFAYEAWEVTDPPLLTVGDIEAVPCRAMLRSSGGEFEGLLEPHGSCTIWGMYSWPSYRVRSAAGTIQAYVLVRPDGPAIQQPVPAGGAPVPHLVVGCEYAEEVSACAAAGCAVSGRVGTRHYATQQQNIRAWGATDPLRSGEQSVVVSAHFDTVPDTPGGYDNAGGVAALLRTAERLAAGELPSSTQLLFTDAEEFLLAGSRAFVARLREQRLLSRVSACVNLDGAGRGDLMEVWLGPEDLVNQIERAIPKGSYYFFPPPMSGDHYAFWEQGVPSVMLTFNDLEILHRPDDVFDTRKARAAERLADACAAIIPVLA